MSCLLPCRGCVKGGVHLHVAVAVKVHDHDHDYDYDYVRVIRTFQRPN